MSKKKLSKRYSKPIIPEHHNSLDAPVFVWQKVNETSDYSWLLLKRSHKVTKQILTALQKAWEKIFNEYIQEFGFSESFLDIKMKEVNIAKMKLQLVLTGDRTLETFIEIEEQELDGMRKVIGKVDFMDSKIAIENKFKFQINLNKTSIREFYSYQKYLK